jgi:hypothetical protein
MPDVALIAPAAKEVSTMLLRSAVLRSLAFAISAVAFPVTASAQLGSIGGVLGPGQPPSSAIGNVTSALVAEHKKRANSYLDSASVIVFGKPRTIYQVIGDMQALTAPGAPTRSDVLLGKFNLVDAIAYEKAKLSNPAFSGMRQSTIDNAFEEVYGRPSTPLEQAQSDPQLRAGKLWFAPLVLAEQARLNGDKQIRTALIQRVFQRAEGRDASPAEVGNWLQRSEDYSALILAARAWLYSPAGANDLIATVARAQAAKNQPTDPASIKAVMAQYEPSRGIYFEMVGLAGMLFKK